MGADTLPSGVTFWEKRVYYNTWAFILFGSSSFLIGLRAAVLKLQNEFVIPIPCTGLFRQLEIMYVNRLTEDLLK